MINPYFFPYMLYPFLPNDCSLPPTIYSLLQSIVNYDKDPQTKIKDLAKIGRSKIFDFNYPLSSKIKKEDFETMILNHFLMRRIGFETLTIFKIQLDVKLNEIMPLYNKLFDSLTGWNLFEDGEIVTRETNDNRTVNNTSNQTKNSTSNTNTTNENTLINNSNTTNNSTEDRRESNLPQSQIDNVKNGSYVTNYQFNTNNSTSVDDSTSTGNSQGRNESTAEDTEISSSDTKDVNKTNEKITRTPNDKMTIYKTFIQEKQNIYTMIFNDLESLFFQVV